MKFSGKTGDRYMASFNFSSLTDIVMLLLIFFLLTSSFVTRKGIDIKLPEATNVETQDDARIYVDINGDGEVTLNDRTATVEELGAMVAQEIAADSTQIVVIRADRELLLDQVIGVLDIVKGAGARRFFIATEDPE